MKDLAEALSIAALSGMVLVMAGLLSPVFLVAAGAWRACHPGRSPRLAIGVTLAVMSLTLAAVVYATSL